MKTELRKAKEAIEAASKNWLATRHEFKDSFIDGVKDLKKGRDIGRHSSLWFSMNDNQKQAYEIGWQFAVHATDDKITFADWEHEQEELMAAE